MNPGMQIKSTWQILRTNKKMFFSFQQFLVFFISSGTGLIEVHVYAAFFMPAMNIKQLMVMWRIFNKKGNEAIRHKKSPGI
jgi:hypothetical protein